MSVTAPTDRTRSHEVVAKSRSGSGKRQIGVGLVGAVRDGKKVPRTVTPGKAAGILAAVAERLDDTLTDSIPCWSFDHVKAQKAYEEAILVSLRSRGIDAMITTPDGEPQLVVPKADRACVDEVLAEVAASLTDRILSDSESA